MKKCKVFIIFLLLMLVTGSGILTCNKSVSMNNLYRMEGYENAKDVSFLESIYIDEYDLDPEFYFFTFKYTVKVSPGTDHLTISYQPQSRYATVEVQGNENLQNGSEIVLKSTSGDGDAVNYYTLTIEYTNSKIIYKILIGILIALIVLLLIFLVLYLLYRRGVIRIHFKKKNLDVKETYNK